MFSSIWNHDLLKFSNIPSCGPSFLFSFCDLKFSLLSVCRRIWFNHISIPAVPHIILISLFITTKTCLSYLSWYFQSNLKIKECDGFPLLWNINWCVTSRSQGINAYTRFRWVREWWMQSSFFWAVRRLRSTSSKLNCFDRFRQIKWLLQNVRTRERHLYIAISFEQIQAFLQLLFTDTSMKTRANTKVRRKAGKPSSEKPRDLWLTWNLANMT